MRWAIVAVVVVVAGTAALVIRPPIKEPALAHELISMRREVDFPAVSFRPGRGVSLGDLPSDLRDRYDDQAKQDERHQDRMLVLLDRYGWPTEKMVGREAVDAALLLVNRAPDLAFKERALSSMREVGANNSPEFAILVDQVAIGRGEPQTYGTQWQCADGAIQYTTPLKDPTHLARLRHTVNLPPEDKFARDICSDPGSDTYIIQRRFGP